MTRYVNYFIIGILLLSGLFFSGCVEDNESDWGENGDLSITLTIEKEMMTIDETNNLTETIKNIGGSKLRIVIPFMSKIKMFDSNNMSVNWTGPEDDPPASPTNKNLEVLESGEMIEYIRQINLRNWDLKRNNTYRIVSHYFVGDYQDITLPYWKGELRSNEIVLRTQ